jgi:hypothetical protein
MKSFRFLIGLCVLLCRSSRALAAFEELSAGARAAGMGSASVADRGPESVFFNPAGMGTVPFASICIFSVLPYGLRELASHSASVVLPSRIGNFGFGVLTYGQTLYRETTFAAGWSTLIGTRIVLGLAARGLNLHIQKYGSWSGWALDAGIQVLLGEKWTFGFAGTDLNQASVAGRNSPLPQTTRIGLRYLLANNATMSLELDKDVRYPVEFRGGIEYCPASLLSLRCGFGRNPSLFSCGFGLNWSRLVLDYACTIHPVLGISHQCSITFQLSP